nr:conotoxin precursor O3 [Conus ebraeus]
MSGLGIMVLTLLLLVTMATGHEGNRVKWLMLQEKSDDGICKTDPECSTGQVCCSDSLQASDGYCTEANNCISY